MADLEFDARAFRAALGAFPTGVVVVTAAGGGAPMGITVNSFTSLSIDPPLVLWCLDRKSQRHDTFAEAPCYVISVLGTAHQEVSSHLARPGEHQLDGFALLPTTLGPPALADSLVVFECAREAVHDGGDHSILVGRVLRFAQRGTGAPLVFFRGKYGALARIS